jgi:hypothetical protein
MTVKAMRAIGESAWWGMVAKILVGQGGILDGRAIHLLCPGAADHLHADHLWAHHSGPPNVLISQSETSRFQGIKSSCCDSALVRTWSLATPTTHSVIVPPTCSTASSPEMTPSIDINYV